MILTVLQCLAVSLSFWIVFDISIYSVIPLLIGIMYGMLVRKGDNVTVELKQKIVVLVFSALFTIFILMAQIERILKFDGAILCISSFAISTMGLFLFFKMMSKQAFSLLSNDEIIIQNDERRIDNPITAFGGILLILLLFWGVQFLMDYPGIVGVDTIENLEQAIGSRKMDVLFPFYMTLYLRFCWNTGLALWGNANAGIALYCGTQTVVLACSVAYLLYRIYICGIKKSFFAVMVAYFALLPYHAHGGYMLLKDTPYAIGTMLFLLSLWEFYIFGIPSRKVEKISKYFLFFTSGVLMALSRANGYYAFIFCLPFLVYVFYKCQKKVIGLIVCCFVVIWVVRGPISDFVISQNNRHIVEMGETVFDIRYQESEKGKEDIIANEKDDKSAVQVSNANADYGSSGVFIITSQQLGRVTVDRELTDEEYDRLSTVINVDKMKETYNKYIVTNAMMQITNHNLEEYLSVWLEFGLKYPYTYFIAWRDQTQGYWDPNMYTGEFDLDFCNRNPEVYRDSLFPTQIVDGWNRLYETMLVKIPMIPLLWSNGFIICITFWAMALTVVKRNWMEVFLFTPLVGLWLTLLVANPCNGQFRYAYSFFLCLPLSLIIPFVKRKSEEKEDECLLH